MRAPFAGRAAAAALHAQRPVVLRPGLTVTNGFAGTSGAGLANVTTSMVEPASQYASAPADMKAYCSAAQASACAYLPPQQLVQMWQGAILDLDGLLAESQCDTTIWNYQVDVHGAVAITLIPQQYMNFTTGNAPSCIVKVTIGYTRASPPTKRSTPIPRQSNPAPMAKPPMGQSHTPEAKRVPPHARAAGAPAAQPGR
ncbi:MAG TPA: hypothetical protein VME66_04490 [Candidatus Acidoferrales bacterium]|nr:hypothetical protein [Candidatus Acidoferrales bacterium]